MKDGKWKQVNWLTGEPETPTEELSADEADPSVGTDDVAAATACGDDDEPTACDATSGDLFAATQEIQQPPKAEHAEHQQVPLFDLAPPWAEMWKGMPSFKQEDLESWQAVKVHFATRADRNAFAELIGQRMTEKTRSIWYPQQTIDSQKIKRYVSSKADVNPRYPVYIISKGRADTRLTAKSLDRIRVPYHIVIEPQEYDAYAAVIPKENILVLPFSNLGQGSIPARNWVWDHSISLGAKRHWILDDNIRSFFRLHQNQKSFVHDGAIFRAAEDFTDRYTNVAQSGFNYFMFAPRKCPDLKPFTLNTRIYSCILNWNDGPHRWRGRYNEDTDLSIRLLKDGYATVLFNCFLAGKMATMTMKGGNTESLYNIQDGRLKMAQSLVDQHPDIVTITEKWGRPQHHVDYRGFKNNKLILRDDIEIIDGADDYGMTMKMLDEIKTEESTADDETGESENYMTADDDEDEEGN